MGTARLTCPGVGGGRPLRAWGVSSWGRICIADTEQPGSPGQSPCSDSRVRVTGEQSRSGGGAAGQRCRVLATTQRANSLLSPLTCPLPWADKLSTLWKPLSPSIKQMLRVPPLQKGKERSDTASKMPSTGPAKGSHPSTLVERKVTTLITTA